MPDTNWDAVTSVAAAAAASAARTLTEALAPVAGRDAGAAAGAVSGASSGAQAGAGAGALAGRAEAIEATTYRPVDGSLLATPMIRKMRQHLDLESDFGAKLDGSSDDTAAHIDAARGGRLVHWPPVEASMRIYEDAIIGADSSPARIIGSPGLSKLRFGTYGQRGYQTHANRNVLRGIEMHGVVGADGKKARIQGNPSFPMLFGDQAYTSAAGLFCTSSENDFRDLGFFDLPVGIRLRSFSRQTQQAYRNRVENIYGARCDFGVIGGNQVDGYFANWRFYASTFEVSDAPNHDIYWAGRFPVGMTPEEPNPEEPQPFYDTFTVNCLFDVGVSGGNLYSSVFKFLGCIGSTFRGFQARDSVCLLSLAFNRDCVVDGTSIVGLRQGLTKEGEPNTNATNQGGIIMADCHDMDLYNVQIVGRANDDYVNGILLRDACSNVRLHSGNIRMGYTGGGPSRSAVRVTRGSTDTWIGPGMRLEHTGGNKPLVVVSASPRTVIQQPTMVQGDPTASALVSVDNASPGVVWEREATRSVSAAGPALANATVGTVLRRPNLAPLLWRPTDLGAARILTLSARQPGALVSDGATGRVVEWRDYYTAGRRLVAQSPAEGPLPLQTSGMDGVDPALQFAEPAYLRAGSNAPELLAAAAGAINATSLALVVAVNASNGGPRNIAGWWHAVAASAPPRILLRHNTGAGLAKQALTQGSGGTSAIVSGGTEDGQWHVVVLRKVGALLEIYQDDISAPLASGLISSAASFTPDDFLLAASVNTAGAISPTNLGPIGAVQAIAGAAAPNWDGDLHNAMRWVGRQVGVIVP